jgi:hypothetical protein
MAAHRASIKRGAQAAAPTTTMQARRETIGLSKASFTRDSRSMLGRRYQG